MGGKTLVAQLKTLPRLEDFLRKAYATEDGERMRRCIQCGLCSGICPASPSMDHTPRAILAWIGAGVLEKVFSSNTSWLCSSCNSCVTYCPHRINMANLITHVRGYIVEEGLIPKTLQDALMSTFRYGNPWGGLQDKRDSWAEGLGVKRLADGDEVDVLYFVGCTPSYDPRNQEVAKAAVSVFNAAGVNFGILGNEERCDGDSILRIGEIGLFEMLVEENTRNFRKHGVDRIVTTSPHSYNTFKKDYPDLAEDFQIQHYTEFLLELIENDQLKFSDGVEAVVAYHDPCFLGRHNEIYEAPRKILESIPGLTLVELERTRKNSFCCGGGGGRMWMEEEREERLCVNRAREVASFSPDILVTACPFCLMNLEDGIKVLGKDDEIKVMDMLEVVREAVVGPSTSLGKEAQP